MNQLRKTISLILLCLLSVSSVYASGRVFVFELPDSLSFEERVITQQIRSADGEQGLVDSTRSYYNRQFVKSPIGFDLISKPDSIIVNRNGERISSPIAEAMAQTETRMIMDYEGHAFSVEGYDKLSGKLSEKDDAEAKAIIESIQPDVMAQKESMEWNNLIDPLIGRDVKLGIVDYYLEELQINANVRLDYFTVLEIVDTFLVDGSLCARVYFHSDTELGRLAQRRNLSESDLSVLFREKPPQKEEASPESRRLVQLVIEIESMKRIGIMSQTEMVMVGLDEQGKQYIVQLRETRDTQISYDLKDNN